MIPALKRKTEIVLFEAEGVKAEPTAEVADRPEIGEIKYEKKREKIAGISAIC